MKFGLALNIMGATCAPALLVKLACAGEDAGVEALWVGDHVVFPREMPRTYGYTPNAAYFQKPTDDALEAISVLTYLAGVVRRPKLGVSVLVVPYRNPVLTAKVLTTLDVLSGGRLIYGVGSGWLEGEFAALDASYEHRGAVTDEYIEIFRRLCSDDWPRYEGRFYRVPEIGFYPKPVQKPWPPIWVGGNTEAALRRAARLGDGWHPLGLLPGEIPERLGRLRAHCETVGRDVRNLTLSLRTWSHLGSTAELGDLPVGQGSLVGDAVDIIDQVRRYEDVGVTHLVVKPLDIRSAEGFERQTMRFLNEVVTKA
jgi:probable F420-dependent oxidoreductase